MKDARSQLLRSLQGSRNLSTENPKTRDQERQREMARKLTTSVLKKEDVRYRRDKQGTASGQGRPMPSRHGQPSSPALHFDSKNVGLKQIQMLHS